MPIGFANVANTTAYSYSIFTLLIFPVIRFPVILVIALLVLETPFVS